MTEAPQDPKLAEIEETIRQQLKVCEENPTPNNLKILELYKAILNEENVSLESLSRFEGAYEDWILYELVDRMKTLGIPPSIAVSRVLTYLLTNLLVVPKP